MSQIRKFNETFEDATIVQRTELNVNDLKQTHLDIFVKGNKVKSIKVLKGDFTISFTESESEDEMNYLYIDLGQWEEEGMFSVEW